MALLVKRQDELLVELKSKRGVGAKRRRMG